MKDKSADIKRIPVYFPLDLYAKVQKSANKYKRSLNKEVLWQLEQRYADSHGQVITSNQQDNEGENHDTISSEN